MNKNRMSRYVLMTAAMFGGAAFAECQPLWPSLEKMPDAQPEQYAAPREDTKVAGFDFAEHRMPYIEWSEKPKNPNGACLILISGGAYNCTCDGPAFHVFEKPLIANGVTCVWLWYRVPRPKGLEIYQSAWEDGQRAVRLVRSQAKARGFDPERIGVMGCSAGSHLSVMLATSALTPAYQKIDALDDIPCHVNWAIPMCPAYALTDGLTGKNTNGGEGATLNPSFRFDAKTAPMCLFHGGKDPYSPLGSTRIYRRLRSMHIPAELHLDADRAHGPCAPVNFERALEFMRQMGYFGKLGKPKAQDHRYFPDNTIRTEKERLWPEGKVPDPQPNHTYDPYLVWYIPEKMTTKSIQVVVPGGGYNFCNINGEGYPVACYLNTMGMACVVVRYRCPRPLEGAKYKSAWQDAQRAIRMVRHEAPARGLDPSRIGIMGFSAGGHLALLCATSARTKAYDRIDEIDDVSCDLQWAVPTYPAYSLTDGVDKPNATGGNDDSAVPVPEFAFDEATPPMCFQHGDADGWAAMNSVKIWEKTRAMGLQGDLHTYATRGHCFQMSAVPGTGSYSWLDRVWDFLGRKKLR